jgi:hypothetical protein
MFGFITASFLSRARYYCRHCHHAQTPESIHKCIHYRVEGKFNQTILFIFFFFDLIDASSVNKTRKLSTNELIFCLIFFIRT